MFKKIFPIEDGEGRLVLLLILLSFFFGAGNNFIEASAFSLFLSEYSPQLLPYTYLITAVVVSSMALGYLKLGENISFARLLMVNISVLAGLALIFQFGMLSIWSKEVKFLMPLLFQIQVNFVNLAFWGLVGQIFSVQQAKRLFGLSSSGLWVAIILTGFAMPIFVGWVGLNNLMWLAAVSMMLGLGCLILVLNQYGQHLQIKPLRQSLASQNHRKQPSVLSQPYIYLIFASMVVWWVIFFFADLLYYDRLSSQFSTNEEIAGFIGVYLGVLGIITWVINTFFSATFFKKFGQRIALMLLPVLMMILAGTVFGASIFANNLWALFAIMVVAKMTDVSIGFSLDRTALTILYQPLPAGVRARTQTIAEGIVQPVSVGIAGVLLILLQNVFKLPLITMYGVFLALTLIWVGVRFGLGQEYLQMLIKALDKRILGTGQVLTPDQTTIQFLAQTLRSSNEGKVLFALNRLFELSPTELDKHLPQMLAHRGKPIRLESLKLIEDRKLKGAYSAIVEIIQGEYDLDEIGRALRTLGTVDIENSKAILQEYLESSEIILVTNSIIGLYKTDQKSAIVAGQKKLKELCLSKNKEERIMAAKTMADINDPAIIEELATLLKDESPSVQREALFSSRQFQSKLLWSGALDLLENPQMGSLIAATLSNIADEHIHMVTDIFHQSIADKKWDKVMPLARILIRVATPQARIALGQELINPNATLREILVYGLMEDDWTPSREYIETTYQQYLDDEIAYYVWCVAAQQDLQDTPYQNTLKEHLAYQGGRAVMRALASTSFIYGKATSAPIVQLLQKKSISQDQVSYALEIIESEFDKENQDRFRPVLLQASPEEVLAQLSGYYPQQINVSLEQRLQEAIQYAEASGSIYFHALVLVIIGEQNMHAEKDQVQAALAHPHPVIQEAAQQALASLSLERPNQENHMLSTIEKVLITKACQIFAKTPDAVLVEIATLLEEIELGKDEILFDKGDAGDCMYLVVTGKIRVHDARHTFNHLGKNTSFGEIAMLDSEPRSATATAMEDSLLLRLDQGAFYELMDERIEVVRGIISQLASYVRSNTVEIRKLREKYSDITIFPVKN